MIYNQVFAQISISLTVCSRESPLSVKLYSTRTGTSEYTLRSTIPSFSSSFKRYDNKRPLIGNAASIALKR